MPSSLGAAKEVKERDSLLPEKLKMGELSKPCKILSWNVRSVLNEERLDNVLQFIEDNDIRIACLCET